MSSLASTPPACRCTGSTWAALALGAAGVGAYVLLLAVPWVRATGLVAFVPLAAALLWALAALRHDRRARTVVPALLTFLLGLSFLWLFFIVARLPDTTAFEHLERAPDVELVDASGARLRLSVAAAGGPVLLVFFRGHW